MNGDDSDTGEIQRETLTVEEAARVLGISRGLAYELVNSGELLHTRRATLLLHPATTPSRTPDFTPDLTPMMWHRLAVCAEGAN